MTDGAFQPILDCDCLNIYNNEGLGWNVINHSFSFKD